MPTLLSTTILVNPAFSSCDIINTNMLSMTNLRSFFVSSLCCAVEGLLMDTVSGGLPILILDMHPWTAALFTSFATMKTVHDHCG